MAVLRCANLSLLLADELLLLGTDDRQDVGQAASPVLESAGNLAPLVVAEYTVGAAVNKELLLLLAELALHKSRADAVNDPHLDVGRRHVESLCDVSVRQSACL